MSSFKSSRKILKKERGPDRSVLDNQSSSVTLNELAVKAITIICNFEFQQRSHTMTDTYKSSNNEEYNSPFNLDELKEAISKSHDTATGPDEIHYQMLKHLPPRSLEALLDIFNDMWKTGKFPPKAGN